MFNNLTLISCDINRKNREVWGTVLIKDLLCNYNKCKQIFIYKIAHFIWDSGKNKKQCVENNLHRTFGDK